MGKRVKESGRESGDGGEKKGEKVRERHRLKESERVRGMVKQRVGYQFYYHCNKYTRYKDILV